MFGSGNISESSLSDVKSVVSDTTDIGSSSIESLQAFQNTSHSLLIDTRLAELGELIPVLLQKMPRLWSKVGLLYFFEFISFCCTSVLKLQ